MFNAQNCTSGVFGEKVTSDSGYSKNINSYVCDWAEEIFCISFAESIESGWITCEYAQG